MPRGARKESESGYYHIMVRGNNREYIFREARWKQHYLNHVKKAVEDDQLEVVAWCIMDNHAHLVVKAQLNVMSQAIKRINTKYAMQYSRHKGKIGHIFQDRYKSEAINSEEYLVGVVKYVQNNPIQAKMVKEAKNYKWSSYHEYLSNETIVASKQKAIIMDYFNGNIENFNSFHKKTDNAEYLDIPEDMNKIRVDKANLIIKDYYSSKNIDILGNTNDEIITLDVLINLLLVQTNLNCEVISKLVNTSFRYVCHLKNKSKRVAKESSPPIKYTEMHLLPS